MTDYENQEEYSTETSAFYDADDPFAPKPKAISWDEAEIPTKIVGTIIQRPKVLRQLDVKSKRPLSWDSGEPKMTTVTVMDVDGKRVSLWAKLPSALSAALMQATEEAGESIRPGGTLEVTIIGYRWSVDSELLTEKPNKRRGMNAASQFEARYTPPS